MPLYEYACEQCDTHFDVRHSADEKPALTCPQCGGGVRKVFHAAGVIFKGSGWYINDSAPNRKKEIEAAETPPAPKTDTPVTPKTETATPKTETATTA
jgi:putative FmdB family regulatory protein